MAGWLVVCCEIVVVVVLLCIVVLMVVGWLIGWLVEIFIDAATKSFQDKIRHPQLFEIAFISKGNSKVFEFCLWLTRLSLKFEVVKIALLITNFQKSSERNWLKCLKQKFENMTFLIRNIYFFSFLGTGDSFRGLLLL